MKALADENSNLTQTMKLVFDRVEIIVGKGEHAGNQHNVSKTHDHTTKF